jgi:hypothetical protein
MQFSLSGILAVLTHAIPPFLPLILAILALLVVTQLIAHLRGYRLASYRCAPAALAALLVGLSTL